MNKIKLRIFTIFIVVILCLTAFSATAFAGGGEEYTELAPEVGETPEPNPLPFTPDGNLTLVDDIQVEDSEEKQYMTVVTKDGNYFYIIIDRAGDKENVYFLNMVDEADLLALIEDMDTAQEMLVTIPEPELESEPVPAPEIEKENDKDSNIGSVLLLLLLVGGGVVGAFYYFKVLKNKPSTKGSTDLKEYEFDYDEDDEDDEDEYEFDDEYEAEEEESEDEL
jgi:hypothetical protein